jgi:hypothetical protein
VGANPNSTPHFTLWNELDSYFVPDPDFKALASLFYSKTLFGVDTFRTGVTLHYLDSEHDINDNFKGTRANFSSDVPGTNYVHLIGSWTTLDWQISYQFGAPAAVTPETPKPGYDKEGKSVVGEKAIAPRTRVLPGDGAHCSPTAHSLSVSITSSMLHHRFRQTGTRVTTPKMLTRSDDSSTFR